MSLLRSKLGKQTVFLTNINLSPLHSWRSLKPKTKLSYGTDTSLKAFLKTA